jgi:hypothetical protein
MDDQVHWAGMGRWLSFVATALLILLSIPSIAIHALEAAAGWNIFLGLLLIWVIASDHRKAPLLAAILCALMLVRLILSLVAESMVDAVLVLLLLGILATAWHSLKTQAARLPARQFNGRLLPDGC